jgi:putative ABC transport system substrate-binding protein
MKRTTLAALGALAMLVVLPGEAEEARAQSDSSVRRIGVVAMTAGPQSAHATAFRQGLRDAGYVEGRDISIDWWDGQGDYGQVSEAIAGMLARKVDVIVVSGTQAAIAARRATSSIPIVMALVADPVGSGLVESLARPGGNVTGLSAMVAELATKRLQLLKEAMPKASRVTAIYNPNAPYNRKVIRLLRAAAPGLEVELSFIPTSSVEALRAALLGLRRSKVDALMVLDDAFMAQHEETILQLVSGARLPAVFGPKPRSAQGALISYAPDYLDQFRRAAGYVDKILKGALPANLPIEQPTRFELVINLKTARTLGLTIPQSVLLQASEVIE